MTASIGGALAAAALGAVGGVLAGFTIWLIEWFKSRGHPAPSTGETE